MTVPTIAPRSSGDIGQRSSTRRLRDLGALALAGLFACQSTAPDLEDLSVQEVLARAQAAHAGTADPEEASFRRRSRVRVFPDGQDPVEGELLHLYRPPNQERLEVVWSSGHTLIQVVNGDEAGEWLDGRVQDRDLSAEVARRRVLRNLIDRFQEPGEPACRLVEVERIQGRDQRVLERSLAGSLWRVWIDARTNLLSRILCSTPAGDERRIHEEWLFDYKTHDGRPVATRHVTMLDGEKVSETWILDYEENVPVSDESFSVKSFPGSR